METIRRKTKNRLIGAYRVTHKDGESIERAMLLFSEKKLSNAGRKPSYLKSYVNGYLKLRRAIESSHTTLVERFARQC